VAEVMSHLGHVLGVQPANGSAAGRGEGRNHA
jgi:hypothetical protein